MPRISEFYGIVIYMYFRDHNPPHFHAIYGEYEAEVEISTGDVLTGSLPKQAERLVREWHSERKNELIHDWELARRHKSLKQIAPLK